MSEEQKKAVGADLLDELKGIDDLDELSGEKVQELMDKYNVSRATVFRTKKKALAISRAEQLSAEDESFIQSQNIIIPKKLQGKIDEVRYYKAYMSDPEEGWTFYKARGDVLQEGNGLFFCGIVYADDLDAFLKMIEPMRAKGIQFCWIMHDKDFWLHDSPELTDDETGVILFAVGERYKLGDPKKLHFHVMIKYSSQTSWQDNQRLVQQFFGIHTVMWEKVKNPMGMYRYFCHDTDDARNSGKFLYPRTERHCENGFAVDLSQYEKNCIFAEISNYINHDMYKEYGRYELCDLMEKYKGDVYTLGVIRGAANLITNHIASCRAVQMQKEQKAMHAHLNNFTLHSQGYDPEDDDSDDPEIDEETGEIIDENGESEDDE